MSILAVPDTSAVTITATGAITHLCPHVDEVDNGRISITWRVDGQTYELHSLAAYLRSFKDSRLSHEALTDRIRHELSVVDGIELVAVETTWTTAGLGVTCSTSPTPAGATL